VLLLFFAGLKLPPDQDNPNLPREEAETCIRLSGASTYGAVQNMIACRAWALDVANAQKRFGTDRYRGVNTG